eukprot:TRINITY_DN2264_c0_g1_i2.p1 TRINITY_DN2264_c0_g1~~TRINITY_DN2264_c0_g1_i2.p1  ORF type:complete len:131 (-),score=19.28 TRINITY_DN2264_c0_g1_i2:45-437(-)
MSGQEDTDRFRALSYPQTSVVLCVFSVVDECSYGDVRSMWYPEVSHYCPNTPIILVGTKVDLRGDAKCREQMSSPPVSFPQGLQLAQEIQAVTYIESSALLQTGLKTLSEETARAVLTPQQTTTSPCTLF